MSTKNNTHDTLIDFYRKNGYEHTLSVARKMLESKKYAKDKKFSADLHGEICESVLEICIMEYVKQHPKETSNWFFTKGMILKDVNNPDSEFLTELDLVLFTPQQICIFECKSYNSDKVLRNECTIVRDNGTKFDAYRQNSLHRKVLMDQFVKFSSIKCDCPDMCRIYLFNFSTGKTVDDRSRENKCLMPHINERNIFSLLGSLSAKRDYWDVRYLKRAVDIINKHQERNTRRHLNYVKELHGKR